MKAIVKLSEGDMRKAINILQSTYASNSQITQEAVYACTGCPSPSDIDSIINTLYSVNDLEQAYYG